MLWVKFDRIYPQSNKFATDVKNKATDILGDSKLNESPAGCIHILGIGVELKLAMEVHVVGIAPHLNFI